MPAFSVIEDLSGDYRGDVYFAKSAIHARRTAANDISDGELGGLLLSRERALDKYEDLGGVPLWEMIDRGWWCECDQCGITINSAIYDDYCAGDMDGRDGEEPHGIFGGATYCSAGCKKEKERRWYVERSMAEAEYGRLRGKILQHFREPIFAGERPDGHSCIDSEYFDRYYIGWLGPNNASFDWCTIWFKVPGVTDWAMCKYRDRRGNEGGHTTISFPKGNSWEYKKYMKKHLDRLVEEV